MVIKLTCKSSKYNEYVTHSMVMNVQAVIKLFVDHENVSFHFTARKLFYWSGNF